MTPLHDSKLCCVLSIRFAWSAGRLGLAFSRLLLAFACIPLLPATRAFADQRPTLTLSMADVRAMRADAATSPATIELSDEGMHGVFRVDAKDTASVDNTGTVLVTKAGVRYKRVYDGASVQASWFGAMPGDKLDDTAAIQAAMEATGPADAAKIVDLASGTYLLSSGITVYRDSCLRGHRSTLLFSGLPAEGRAITVSEKISRTMGAPRTVLSDLIVSGSEGPYGVPYPQTAAEYLDATGIYFETHEVGVEDVQIIGFGKGVDFDTNAYLDIFTRCSFRSNKIGIYFNAEKPGRTNLGENMRFIACCISNSLEGLYNALGELVFTDCSFDYNRVHVSENITRIRGTSSSTLSFTDCHFEDDQDRTMIVNNGSMSIRGGAIWSSGVAGAYIKNNDELVLGGIHFRAGGEGYLVSGNTPTGSAANLELTPIDFVAIHPHLSGFPNGDFSEDLAGWEGVHGKVERSTEKAHMGSESLKLEGSKEEAAEALSPRLRTSGRECFLTYYVDSSRMDAVSPMSLVEYDYTGEKVLRSTELWIPKAEGEGFHKARSNWVTLHPQTEYVRFRLRGEREGHPSYWDDFYLRFR